MRPLDYFNNNNKQIKTLTINSMSRKTGATDRFFRK